LGQHLRHVAPDVDARHAVALGLERVGAGLAGSQRDRTLRGKPAHENGNVLLRHVPAVPSSVWPRPFLRASSSGLSPSLPAPQAPASARSTQIRERICPKESELRFAGKPLGFRNDSHFETKAPKGLPQGWRSRARAITAPRMMSVWKPMEPNIHLMISALVSASSAFSSALVATLERSTSCDRCTSRVTASAC